MKQSNKLWLLFVYYLIFMYSFFGFYRTKLFIDGKSEAFRIGLDLFGKSVEIAQSTNIPGIKIANIVFIALTFLSAAMMIIVTISYNLELIHKEHVELKEEMGWHSEENKP
ncbi:MAG: hypothetical protein HGA85_01550 [Nanoarchaeota archaeon]|nr:hypothetical protein [Nanoarchaeota archaeon]